MLDAWVPTVLAAPATLALIAFAVRPAHAVIAARRLAVVRAAVIVGAFAVLTVEVSSAFNLLMPTVIGSGWIVAVLASAAAARIRWVRDRRTGIHYQPAGRPRAWIDLARDTWQTADRSTRLLVASTGALIFAELVVALLAKPNNYDSQTYHLPRIEHWVSQRNVGFFPTAIHRQVDLPPGAEYLLTHLRLLTGGDALYNLLQWSAGVGCVLLATRIAAQLGGGRRAQLLTAFLVATTPMIILQASSTQTDLVAAAWTACAATLALDGLRARTRLGAAVLLGLATGLTALTKTPGLLATGPMLIMWAAAQVRLGAGNARAGLSGPAGRPRGRTPKALALTLVAGAVVGMSAAIIVGPFIARVNAEFGNPLGPPELRDSIPMQRHDLPAILINGLKIAATALDTPFSPIRHTAAAGIDSLAHGIGINPQDPQMTFESAAFPVPAWYPDEDRVSFPLQGTLAVIAVAIGVVRPRRLNRENPDTSRAYASVIVTGAILFAATVKWQPWGNRLLIFAVVLAMPMVGLWLDNVLRRGQGSHDDRPPPGWATRLTAVVLTACAISGALAVSYGFPRRLVGTGSVFTVSGYDSRFLRRPHWQAEFQNAAAQIKASGAHRLGLVQQHDSWEYPWWLLLPGRDIVALQSVLPHHPPPSPQTVQAIICTGSEEACARYVPAGWTLHFDGYVGYALPNTS